MKEMRQNHRQLLEIHLLLKHINFLILKMEKVQLRKENILKTKYPTFPLKTWNTQKTTILSKFQAQFTPNFKPSCPKDSCQLSTILLLKGKFEQKQSMIQAVQKKGDLCKANFGSTSRISSCLAIKSLITISIRFRRNKKSRSLAKTLVREKCMKD